MQDWNICIALKKYLNGKWKPMNVLFLLNNKEKSRHKLSKTKLMISVSMKNHLHIEIYVVDFPVGRKLSSSWTGWVWYSQ